MTVTGQELLAVWASPGPDPDYAAQLAMFGRFVGSWDIEVIEYD